MEKPTVKLIGTDGNAFAVLAKVRVSLKKSGADKETVERFTKEAMAGSYDNLLAVTMKYVDVE